MDLRRMIRSAILGVAVGDALGVPAEFLSREVRRDDPVKGMRGGGLRMCKTFAGSLEKA